MRLPKPKVLFFAEGATLAHVVRPLALARALDPDRFEVTFCRPSAYKWLTSDVKFRVVDLECQSGSVFVRRLEKLARLYDFATLMRYVDDDLALIDAEQPDVIVGDFRLSLSVSARLRAIPYITVCDVYWSPENSASLPLPVLGITRYLPISVVEPLFRPMSGFASRWHALPMERLRARYGLPSLGFDLQRCYTDADLRLFADIPMLFPKVYPGADAAYIGPITWFPSQGADPGVFDDDGPLVYVTMGSSCNSRLLGRIISILEQLDCQVMVTTAGNALTFKPTSARTRVFDYLPDDLLCQHAQLVVCNGDSATTNQALVNGVPVLGVARNMDQFLNMQAVERFGAGLLVRADRASSSRLHEAAEELLREWWYTERAQKLAAGVSPESIATVFSRHVLALCANPAPACSIKAE
ncbi:nucleotide disphospho-sugar-binding domain-containing protein [Propionivibrio sp.]|uniref:glycosyltransferase n=1 Tax=Propionivibrio sp. TaxID=2212460 RepID=UPI0026264669|nr:nucleotide disphospho-sugar-binding domain-containing protein [Propionivibrio sp.]